jgi:hypothetical protein
MFNGKVIDGKVAVVNGAGRWMGAGVVGTDDGMSIR